VLLERRKKIKEMRDRREKCERPAWGTHILASQAAEIGRIAV
jgi:hypothetical protein